MRVNGTPVVRKGTAQDIRYQIQATPGLTILILECGKSDQEMIARVEQMLREYRLCGKRTHQKLEDKTA